METFTSSRVWYKYRVNHKEWDFRDNFTEFIQSLFFHGSLQLSAHFYLCQINYFVIHKPHWSLVPVIYKPHWSRLPVIYKPHWNHVQPSGHSKTTLKPCSAFRSFIQHIKALRSFINHIEAMFSLPVIYKPHWSLVPVIYKPLWSLVQPSGYL